MVETGGSQCGYCTPGIIMAMFSLYKNHHQPTRNQIDDALTGNLCRCTGYKPIVEAAAKSCLHAEVRYGTQACVRQGIDSISSLEPEVAQLLRSIAHNSATIKTEKQTYFQPTTLLEALTLKHQHPDALVVCGATDVALRVTKKHELLEKILDLSAVEELNFVH